MDFVMTYGWAVLIVLVLVAVLGFLGVLSPEKLSSEECIFLHPLFKCEGYSIAPDSATLVLSNSQTKEVTVDQIKINDCVTPFGKPLLPNAKDTFVVYGCVNGESKKKFNGDLEIKYTEKETGLSKNAFATIKTLIQ